MRARNLTTIATLLVALAIPTVACGRERGGEHLSRELLVYTSTSIDFPDTTTTSTTSTTATTTTLVEPPPTTGAVQVASPAAPPAATAPPAVDQAAARTAALETVLAEVEQALGEIDAALVNTEDQG